MNQRGYSELAEPSPERLARRLLELAMHLPAKKLATAKRGPKVTISKGGVSPAARPTTLAL